MSKGGQVVVCSEFSKKVFKGWMLGKRIFDFEAPSNFSQGVSFGRPLELKEYANFPPLY